LQHRYVADEIPLVGNSEFVFNIVLPLKYLNFAAQNNSQADVPLPGLVHHVPALRDTALSQWFKQRKLMIV
jgi:hypothetical protein